MSGWKWSWRNGEHVQVYVYDLTCQAPGCGAHSVFEGDLPAPWYSSMGKTLCPNHSPSNEPVERAWEVSRYEQLQQLRDGRCRWLTTWPSGQVTYSEADPSDARVRLIAAKEKKP